MERLILLIFLLSFNTHGFTLNNSAGAHFKSDEITVNVASHTCNNIGVTNDELLSLAEEAAERFWNTISTSRLIIKRGDIRSVSGDFQTGLVCQASTNCTPTEALKVSDNILISCNTNAGNFSNSVSVLGVTVPNNISGDAINGSLILVNDNAGNQFANKSRDEQIAILAHEIGHAVGIGHSKFDRNLMYYQSIPTREKVGWDDVDAMTWLYPVEQPLGGCGSIDLKTNGPKNGQWILSLLLGLGLFLSLRKLRSFQR